MNYSGMPQRRASLRMLLSILMGAILLAGLTDARGQTTASPDPAITNATCPVTVGEAVDPRQWVEYQGKRVYFCCVKCKRQFERDPQANLGNLPQLAQASPEAVPHADGHEHHEHADDSTQTGLHDEEQSTAASPPEAHPPAATDQHDHAAHKHGSGSAGLLKLLTWLGNFHPPSVSFPIALLISGALAELLLMATGRPLFDAAARFCVWLGGLSTVAAVTLGWFFAGFHLTDPDWIMTLHRWLGTAAGVWAILLLVLSAAAHRPNAQAARWRRWYRLALFLAAAAVAVNGFFGGAMIYGLDHYVW
ncbi:MAG: DUF2231 domain-containing protein [Phycisphaeraceae bacterium]